MQTPQQQLDGFLDKFAPDIAAHARAVLDRVRPFAPGATELVYDNYHALVVSFGATTRAADAVLSVAVYPRWVTLFFMQGVALDDPFQLLHGTGSTVRGVRIKELAQFDDEHLQMLIEAAVAMAATPLDEHGERRLVIKSVSERQRPRR